MKIMRRVVFPVLWLAVFAIIAVALVKIAFGSGLENQSVAEAPAAQLTPATLTVGKTTINNVVEIKASIRNDPAIPILSTAAGQVVQLYVKLGEKVSVGDLLLQVKSEVPASVDENLKAAAQPKYRYLDVVAANSGVLDSFPVLLEQQLSVGQNLGSINPQTLSVEGDMSTDQQFRLMKKPATAVVTVNSGPAPFDCVGVAIGSAKLPGDSGNSDTSGSSGVSGTV